MRKSKKVVENQTTLLVKIKSSFIFLSVLPCIFLNRWFSVAMLLAHRTGEKLLNAHTSLPICSLICIIKQLEGLPV